MMIGGRERMGGRIGRIELSGGMEIVGCEGSPSVSEGGEVTDGMETDGSASLPAAGRAVPVGRLPSAALSPSSALAVMVALAEAVELREALGIRLALGIAVAVSFASLAIVPLPGTLMTPDPVGRAEALLMVEELASTSVPLVLAVMVEELASVIVPLLPAMTGVVVGAGIDETDASVDGVAVGAARSEASEVDEADVAVSVGLIEEAVSIEEATSMEEVAFIEEVGSIEELGESGNGVAVGKTGAEASVELAVPFLEPSTLLSVMVEEEESVLDPEVSLPALATDVGAGSLALLDSAVAVELVLSPLGSGVSVAVG
jgi:hypothetical protein